MFALATDYTAIIRPLQVIVLVVAGLFLLRVMRVALVEMRPPKTEESRRSRRRAVALGLEFIEPEEYQGHRVDVRDALVIGRAGDCDLPLQDTYLSSHHARFSSDDGELLVEDLGSTNGTYVNQELIAHRTKLDRGDIVQVGGVLFEVVR